MNESTFTMYPKCLQIIHPQNCRQATQKKRMRTPYQYTSQILQSSDLNTHIRLVYSAGKTEGKGQSITQSTNHKGGFIFFAFITCHSVVSLPSDHIATQITSTLIPSSVHSNIPFKRQQQKGNNSSCTAMTMQVIIHLWAMKISSHANKQNEEYI
jgi:hypothetical protein